MTMDRVNAILANEEYKDWMEQIRRSEKERRFCCHGIDHCLDVARIGMLMNLEEKLGLEPELIYAAALLHDGRSAIRPAKNIIWQVSATAGVFCWQPDFPVRKQS